MLVYFLTAITIFKSQIKRQTKPTHSLKLSVNSMDFRKFVTNSPEILKFIVNINNTTANIANVPKLMQTPYRSMVSIFQPHVSHTDSHSQGTTLY